MLGALVAGAAVGAALASSGGLATTPVRRCYDRLQDMTHAHDLWSPSVLHEQAAELEGVGRVKPLRGSQLKGSSGR
jgi:hypothetical protein